MEERIKTGPCECGAIVAGTSTIRTVEGAELAQCAACGAYTVVA